MMPPTMTYLWALSWSRSISMPKLVAIDVNFGYNLLHMGLKNASELYRRCLCSLMNPLTIASALMGVVCLLARHLNSQ